MTSEQPSLADHWENRYNEKDAMWSGKVNPTLQSTIADLDLNDGQSVDLGCGEGADVVWLAEQGFDAMGVDISATAIKRAKDAAQELTFKGSTTFIAADLADWLTNARKEGLRFDLITASFLHSPDESGQFDRDQILLDASALVAPGGFLVTVSHAAAPSWADVQDFHGVTPEDEKRTLDISDEEATADREFTVVSSAIVTRDVTDPDGNPATLDDGVFVIQRVD